MAIAHWLLLADLVLLLHLAIVLFVVGSLPAIFWGNRCGWRWVNHIGFRLLHLVAIAVVVLQAWLGQDCFLTSLESWLRVQAGEEGYSASFIQHWVHRFLFYDAPMWQFALIYSLFALLVCWSWWRYPPSRQR